MSASRHRTVNRGVAQHRPAVASRRYRHDDYIAGDLFSGFGGMSRGIERAGFRVIVAANHNEYKVEVHEANHPTAEHWIADLVDETSPSYHDVRQLPRVDFLVAGVSCVNHSLANSKKAYRTGLTLFELEDPEWDERVTKSERDRATANCCLHYAQVHRPKLILIECTTELTSWGDAIPGTNIGDGSAYRWWFREFLKLGYRSRTSNPLTAPLYLNSEFFGVCQDRNRAFWCFWLAELPAPDLEHRPEVWCQRCDRVERAVWSWRTGPTRTGRVRYGEQYDYRCPACASQVFPPRPGAITALDLSDLGEVIGERKKPLARSTMTRVEKCIRMMRHFPMVVTHTKAQFGGDVLATEPLPTQTSQQTAALVTPAALAVVAGNAFERDGSTCRVRGLDEPMWTQSATNTMGLVTPPPLAGGVITYRAGVQPVGFDQPLPTQAGHESLAVVTAGVLPFRQNTLPTGLGQPMPTQTGGNRPALVTAGAFLKQNGGPLDTAPHPFTDPFGTLTARDTTGLVTATGAVDEWHRFLDGLTPEQCRLRMLSPREIQRGCGFDDGFIVWGSARDQVDGFGNAVSPPVAEWIAGRMAAVL